jgi:hypothetical protein
MGVGWAKTVHRGSWPVAPPDCGQESDSRSTKWRIAFPRSYARSDSANTGSVEVVISRAPFCWGWAPLPVPPRIQEAKGTGTSTLNIALHTQSAPPVGGALYI